MIRLVKGAFAEPANVAFPKKSDTDAAFEQAIARAGNVVLVDALDVQPLRADRLAIERVIRALPRFADAAHATAIFPLPKFPKRVNQFWRHHSTPCQDVF